MVLLTLLGRDYRWFGKDELQVPPLRSLASQRANFGQDDNLDWIEKIAKPRVERGPWDGALILG